MSRQPEHTTEPSVTHVPLYAIFRVFLVLGCTSFGGPVAHLGYFRDAFVNRRKWLSDEQYADLMALCQMLPGPTSSQVGFGIGYLQGGIGGALAAFVGFTLPSVLLLLGAALWLNQIDSTTLQPWLHGLQLTAVAVVAHAVWNMAQSLCPDVTRALLAIGVALLMWLLPMPSTQYLALMLAAMLGGLRYRQNSPQDGTGPATLPTHHSTSVGLFYLAVFALLLLALPLLAALFDDLWLQLTDIFYRAGALVFGGGHVVLPLLQIELVPAGLVSGERFLTGYSLAQGVPGPLFTFAAFLGGSFASSPILGGSIAVIAIFLPGFLLLLGVLPFWGAMQRFAMVRAALLGVNAGVVGLLLAALYDHVWRGAVFTLTDAALVLVAFGALQFLRVPAYVMLVVMGLLSGLLAPM